jgi:hypothetical protein
MVKFTDRAATGGGTHGWHSRKHTGTTNTEIDFATSATEEHHIFQP